MPRSVYIHIPFCHHICPYCDFNKVVLKGQPVMEYLQALEEEMDRTLDAFPSGEIETIFVGGGTPTALDKEQMAYFLQSVERRLKPQAENMEFTMEANPGTVNEEKLRIMKEGGVNRLSFGVQSFDASLLKKLGRSHGPEEVLQSIEWARKAGFDNISIDLMFGLPDQTQAMLEADLDLVLQLQVPHLSAYSLIIEEGTHFHSLYLQDKLPLPQEEEEADMYAYLIERMQAAGYAHYEISNFARPGYESRHNLTYWHNEEYYGLGAGAHGYVHGVRHENAESLSDYIQLVREKGLSHRHRHEVTSQEAMEEMMIMGLRLQEGVSRADFYHCFGMELESVFGKELTSLGKKGLLQMSADRYHLTERGIFLANEVFVSFIGN